MFNTADSFSETHFSLLLPNSSSKNEKKYEFVTICYFDFLQEGKKQATLTCCTSVTTKLLFDFIQKELISFYGSDRIHINSKFEQEKPKPIGTIEFSDLSVFFEICDQKIALIFKRVEISTQKIKDKIKMLYCDLKCEVCEEEQIKHFISNMIFRGNVCISCFDILKEIKWPDE